MATYLHVDKDNLSQRVYTEIRSALMNGMYVTGERLRIGVLAEAFGTSNTPVREAIFRLVSEQALEVTAATSISVPKLSVATVSEIQLMRSLLEGVTAGEAARKASKKEIGQLEKIQEQFVKASATSTDDAVKRNREFHFELMAISRLPNVLAVVESLWVRMGPLMNTFHTQVPKQNIYNESHPHYKVIEGLKHRNPDLATSAIREDIQWGERVLTEWMNGRSVENIRA